MHLLHLTCLPSMCLERVSVQGVACWAEPSNTARFISECWISHVTYWILHWRRGTEWLWLCRLLTLVMVGWLWAVVGCHCPASRENFVRHVAGPGIDPKSKFQVWFLLIVNCICSLLKLNHLYVGACPSTHARVSHGRSWKIIGTPPGYILFGSEVDGDGGWLSVWLGLESWSWGPGAEHWVWLPPQWGVCLSLSAPPAARSLSTK